LLVLRTRRRHRRWCPLFLLEKGLEQISTKWPYKWTRNIVGLVDRPLALMILNRPGRKVVYLQELVSVFLLATVGFVQVRLACVFERCSVWTVCPFYGFVEDCVLN